MTLYKIIDPRNIAEEFICLCDEDILATFHAQGFNTIKLNDVPQLSLMKGGAKMANEDVKIPVTTQQPLVKTGTYKGTIVASEIRTTQNNYLYYDLIFNVLDIPGVTEVPQLKLGFSITSGVNPSTELGILVTQFQPLKKVPEVYTKTELDNILVGKVFTFDVINSASAKNPQVSYSNIVKSTLKVVK